MAHHILPVGKLYILSGLPASGKTTLLKQLNLPDGFVLSSDDLRKKLYSAKPYMHNDTEHEHLYGWGKPGQVLFDLMRTMTNERMKEGLTTFIDATSLTDTDRMDWARLAHNNGQQAEVIVFDVPVDELKKRDASRKAKVGEAVIDRMAGVYQKQSKLPFRVVTSEDTFSIETPKLEGDAYDVVGDVHGLFDEFIQLIKTLGYQHDENGVPYHEEGRKLLFLGDVVDRGRQSLLMLHYVEQAVNRGQHVFVPGNHEDKLLKTWEQWQRTKEAKGRSRSSTETFLALMAQPHDVQERLMQFIRQQPAFRVVESHGEQFACVHADITYFNPVTAPRSGIFYGDSDFGKVDSDAEYQKGFERGWNTYTLLRGHIPQVSSQRRVFSVEFDQAFSGHLAILRLDHFAKDLQQKPHAEAFDNNVKKLAIQFNYDQFMLKHFCLADAVQKYEKQGYVRSYLQKETGMKTFDFNDIQTLIQNKRVKKVEHPDTAQPMALYKYGKSVFFDNLWAEHPFLVKARGLVLDMAGHIVQHPFDKIFNYGENGTALELLDSEPVEAIEKLNGFMGCITKNPYSNDLLVTTTGSFDSPFVGYINDFVTPEMKERLLTYFNELERTGQGSKTLLFEVIHPEDNEHPIEYKVEEQGLWLIGARGKQIEDHLESEDYLDLIGGELGFRRPQRFQTTFGEVRKWANEHDGEGYIVRHKGEPITKFKTTSYLAVKFVGRLSENNIAFMYNQPEKFKLKLDEEYVPMVDALLKVHPTPESYKALPRSERMSLMRDIVKNMRLDSEQEVAQHVAALDVTP